jgi:hypothetical protein
MNRHWIVGMGFVMFWAASTASAQGIRGVTRRTPTVVQGQVASQFFAAGGLPLNPVNPGLATLPGSPQSGAMGARGFAMTPQPATRFPGAATAAQPPRLAPLPIAPAAAYPQPSRSERR